MGRLGDKIIYKGIHITFAGCYDTLSINKQGELNMKAINITAATKKLAEAQEMYVEVDEVPMMYNDGVEAWIPAIIISEESSDFMVAYGFNEDGTLYLVSSPDYVKGLPECIETSIELKNVVKYLVKVSQELDA